MTKLWVSVDVEPDFALPNSHAGLTSGIPRLLDVLASVSIPADFFALGEVVAQFPGIIRRIVEAGHTAGSHSNRHELLCLRPLHQQLAEIRASTQTISRLVGRPVSMFRAPNFSANGATVRALEELGILCDSSVLPGRVARRWRALSVYDHRSAPRRPYRPSRKDIDSPGESDVWEVPVTENPLQPGTPIGLGFLNSQGVDETVRAVEMAGGEYVAFLIHPWEAVDMPVRSQRLPRWLESACSADLDALIRFLDTAKDRWGVTTANEIVSAQGSR